MRPNVIPMERSSDLHDRVTAAYEDARDDVYYYVLTLGLSPGQAQEVAQEVFLRLYVSLRDGDEIQNVRGWVFRVAHNFALKLRAKERAYVAVEPQFEMASGGASPETQAIEGQRERLIREALGDLSEQQRQCLYLRASGLRYREIGETLGIATSTVNEFLRRAIARLKKALHE